MGGKRGLNAAVPLSSSWGLSPLGEARGLRGTTRPSMPRARPMVIRPIPARPAAALRFPACPAPTRSQCYISQHTPRPHYTSQHATRSVFRQ